MSLTNLRQLFKPTSVAVIGASNEPGTPGYVAMHNLLNGKFLGPVMPLCDEEGPIQGVDSYRDVDTLPLTPDLAVVCSPFDQVPGSLAALGRRGVAGAVVLSRGSLRLGPEVQEERRKAIYEATKPYDMRILGPNCLGFINPGIGLNASLAHRDALPGRIAFISQSDSLFTAVLDWATSQGIGFSHFISLGDRLDIHLGHLLDYLNSDPDTRAVLLYIETIRRARAFMSAARATARNKPVLVIKSGRSGAGALAAATHSHSYLGSDDVYDAAIRRAGMLRVSDIDALFDTVETLARTRPLQGDRLAIVTNGGSPGFLATDALIAGGGKLADLNDMTRLKLDEHFAGCMSYMNPLVLHHRASGEMYEKALAAFFHDPEVDAVLVMHVPTATVSSVEVAEAVIKAAKGSKRILLTSWLGIDDAAESRRLFSKAGIPTYFTPEKAIRAFLNMVQYRRNQEMLMETPPSLPEDFEPEPLTARDIIHKALEQSRQVLSEPEAKDVLSAYDIPTVDTRVTADMDGVEGAVAAADELGYPVALKILTPDIARKSLVGGVVLDLEAPQAVRRAAAAILARVKEHRPDARILGFTVQRMMRRAGAHELAIEVATDPVFGPVIRFGQGGSLSDILGDRETALPPLSMSLAKELVSRTRVFKLLQGRRDMPAADLSAICLTLVKISQLIIDIPEIFELEINPLFADDQGVLAQDAHISVAKATATGAEQLAIRPYPRELEECAQLKDGRQVHLMPIRPEDEPAHWDFLENCSAQDKRYRFFGNVGSLPRSEMTKLTQIDYDREMAVIAKGPDANGEMKTLGVVRAMTDPSNTVAEFAIMVRSDMKRTGLGRILMEKIIRYCRARGTNRIEGQALSENQGMIGLARAVGFEVRKDFEDDVFDFKLYLNPS